MNRYEDLHTPGLVAVAEKIALLALDAEERTGKATLFLTQYDIARAIGEECQMVALALRLSYTGEFMDEYGWGVVSPGSGRSGAIHGYMLLNGQTTGSTEEVRALLRYTARWSLDHARGLQTHFAKQAVTVGRNRREGKMLQRCADMMTGVVAHLEEVAEVT